MPLSLLFNDNESTENLAFVDDIITFFMGIRGYAGNMGNVVESI